MDTFLGFYIRVLDFMPVAGSPPMDIRAHVDAVEAGGDAGTGCDVFA